MKQPADFSAGCRLPIFLEEARAGLIPALPCSADYDRPFTIPRGGTLSEIDQLIHKEFAQNLRFARVWGSNVHDGTTVKGDYVLHDKDVV